MSVAQAETAIGERYGVSVTGNFTLDNLKIINTTLAACDPVQVKGIVNIVATNFGDGVLGSYNYPNSVISLNPDTLLEPAALYHEIAHNMDNKSFGKNAFAGLYRKSTQSEDFARAYGMTNQQEDFATCMETYFTNTASSFNRAISQAQNGDTVFLEKMLFCLNVQTSGHANSANTFTVNGNSVATAQLQVQRDNAGKITQISNSKAGNAAWISLYNADGSYNFTGLSSIFS